MKWIALLVATLLSWPVLAQPPQCGDHKEAIEHLGKKYGEQLTGIGTTSNAVLELYTSGTGSWTILLVLPGGKACLAGSGEDWENIAPKPLGTDS